MTAGDPLLVELDADGEPCEECGRRSFVELVELLFELGPGHYRIVATIRAEENADRALAWGTFIADAVREHVARVGPAPWMLDPVEEYDPEGT